MIPFYKDFKNITVKEFIKELEKRNDNDIVLLSVDEEQNAIADHIAMEQDKGYIILIPVNPK